jgi:lipopolysaccharide heptosyltransferase II
MALRLREKLLYGALRVAHAFDRRAPALAELGTPAIRRVLAVSSTAIGDTLLSTPALRSLRLAYPDARIALLINAAYIDLFRDLPHVDELIPYRGGWRRFLRLARSLRAHRFDLACILHGNEPQATPLAWLSGARFIFKLPNTSRFRFLLTNAEPVLGWDDFEHGIDQRLAVARLGGGAVTDRRMDLPVADEARRQIARLLADCNIAADAPLIALQAGASTASRRWAPARFVELARRLLTERPRLCIVLTGSPNERPLAARIAAELTDTRVWNAAGELPLPLLPALVERCALMVSGDTGPMHLAVAVGTPVVALFAVSDWRRSGPAYDFDRHVVIQKWRTCDPCLSKNCPYAEPICMENIAVDEVFAAATGILDGKTAP